MLRKELLNLKSNNSKYKNHSELTKSEILSIINRITRFLIWKTHPENLHNYSYLDSKALEEGFKEIQPLYKGEVLL